MVMKSGELIEVISFILNCPYELEGNAFLRGPHDSGAKNGRFASADQRIQLELHFRVHWRLRIESHHDEGTSIAEVHRFADPGPRSGPRHLDFQSLREPFVLPSIVHTSRPHAFS